MDKAINANLTLGEIALCIVALEDVEKSLREGQDAAIRTGAYLPQVGEIAEKMAALHLKLLMLASSLKEQHRGDQMEGPATSAEIAQVGRTTPLCVSVGNGI